MIVLPVHECKWIFKEGDVAVLSTPRPGSGMINAILALILLKSRSYKLHPFCFKQSGQRGTRPCQLKMMRNLRSLGV